MPLKTRTLRQLLETFALVSVFVCSAASAAPGDLYVVESTGVISKFTPSGVKSTFASGLNNPVGLAFDRAGNLFLSEAAVLPGTIAKLTPEGVKSTFATTQGYPLSLAFDGAGNLFVEETFGDPGDILKFTPAGTKSVFISGLYFHDLTFDRLGNLFVASGGPTNINGGIVWYSPDGTAHTFSLNEGPPLAFDAAGNLFVGSFDGILRYTPLPERERSVFATGVTDASDFAFDASGNLFVTDIVSGTILKFAPDGSRSTFASALTLPRSLAFEPVTEKLRNISARGLVGTGDDVLIGGFIVGGSALANNAVVVRAIGPSLAQAGVTNPLADPTLELRDSSGGIVISNDDWQDSQEDQITESGLAPSDPNEAAVYATLSAGNYTAVVRGAGETAGTALVEIYSIAP